MSPDMSPIYTVYTRLAAEKMCCHLSADMTQSIASWEVLGHMDGSNQEYVLSLSLSISLFVSTSMGLQSEKLYSTLLLYMVTRTSLSESYLSNRMLFSLFRRITTNQTLL